MKIYTPWVKEWLRRTMSDHEIVEALEQAGIEVEQFISSEPIDRNVIVALVKKVMQHPKADRLSLVFVDAGDREVRVVCGAPNVRKGLKVAFAQVGSTLPGGDKIAAAKLRGELSEGMLCSERELGIGTNHEQILELSDTAVVGARLCDIYPSGGIVDIKTQANRFDLLSVVGLAREIGAIAGAELKDLPEPQPEAETDAGVKLMLDDMKASQFMLATLQVDVKAPSPRWMTSALQAVGVRSISPIVDVTNYVNLEFGQPLHAYDAAKVRLPLEARLARQGEKLVTLDGVERKLSHQDLVIADATGPIGLAGLMGGASTQVDEKTKEIVLEAATFDAATVRKMAKRHGLRTEASARFERGLPVQLAPVAVARAVELLVEVAGGRVGAVQRQLNVWPWVQRIGLRRSLLNRLLGFEVLGHEAVQTLARLQIEARVFDVAQEARSHIGKPYKFGARYKTDGTDAFDCSYLTDYLYSLIGVNIGHTAHQQFKSGWPVKQSELVPGDLLFAGGDWVKLDSKEREGVAHVAVYVGDGKIVQASDAGQPGVHEAVLEVITKHSEYLGARRYVDNLDDYLSVPAIPWWRPDLKEAQDLVEEIVRVLGYERVPAKIPAWQPQEVSFDSERSKRRRLQQVLYGAGLFEVMTYSFVSEEQLAGAGLDAKKHLKLRNPLSTEQAYLRSSLLASHLSVLARNRGYAAELAFYELSRVFEKRGAADQPDEPMHLGIMVARPDESYQHAKGLLDTLADELGVNLAVEPVAEVPALYAGGRVAKIKLDGRQLGTIGQLDPEGLRRLKVAGEAAYVELDADALLKRFGVRAFAGLERFPSVGRDLAVVVPASTAWQDVAVALADLPQTQVSFVSDYYGEGVPAGHKSLALHLKVAHADRTPTDAEAADIERKALAILSRKFGAKVRA